jgi:nuclease S1
MHVADRNDRGGNALQLRSGRYEYTNLHQVWDSGLFHWRYRQHAEAELVRDISAMAGGREAHGWPRGRLEDWADESLQIGKRAYLIPRTSRTLRPGDEIGRDYMEANLPIAVERIAQSGVRLAAMLNEILD